MAEVQGELELADADVFMELHDWSLLDHPAHLTEQEFALRETARSFEIDLDGNRVTYQFASEEEQLALDVDVEGWTEPALVLWLERQVRQEYTHPAELRRWLSDLVGHLTGRRGVHLAALMRCKFILARRIREKLDAIYRAERRKVYQLHLLAPAARVEVSFENGFAFRDGMYHDQRRYRGRWKPRRHFLGPDQVPAFDGAEEGAELLCAQAIDSLPGVRYWVRNVARHPSSFWLPTAKHRFYPDFVAQLDDGRWLVVEYKGAHLATGDETDEKRVVGALWERSGGGLFLMAEQEVDGLDVRAQLLRKVGTAGFGIQDSGFRG
jgi:type III restriction enzyme